MQRRPAGSSQGPGLGLGQRRGGGEREADTLTPPRWRRLPASALTTSPRALSASSLSSPSGTSALAMGMQLYRLFREIPRA